MPSAVGSWNFTEKIEALYLCTQADWERDPYSKLKFHQCYTGTDF